MVHLIGVSMHKVCITHTNKQKTFNECSNQRWVFFYWALSLTIIWFLSHSLFHAIYASNHIVHVLLYVTIMYRFQFGINNDNLESLLHDNCSILFPVLLSLLILIHFAVDSLHIGVVWCGVVFLLFIILWMLLIYAC